MSTTLAKLETVERKWYVIDSAGKPLGRNCLGRLHLCKGAEHNHAAQKPEAWTLD